MKRAVIDVGSNSLILLIAERQGQEWVPIAEHTRITGLGIGAKATGNLRSESIRDTLQALTDLFEISRQAGADDPIAAATMAVRIAKNQQEFLELAAANQTPVVVVSGDEEARLGFEAVANDPLFASSCRISIVDPGGNSTELMTCDRVAAGWQTRFKRSYPVGGLGLRDGVLKDEAPDFAARLNAVEEIDNIIGLDYLPNQHGTTIVLGATGTNLISIREAMTTWNPDVVHGATLDYEEVGRAVGWLCSLGDEGRRNVVGLQPGRERTIHIGSLILERFLQALHTWECKVSIRGWRHAFLSEID